MNIVLEASLTFIATFVSITILMVVTSIAVSSLKDYLNGLREQREQPKECRYEYREDLLEGTITLRCTLCRHEIKLTQTKWVERAYNGIVMDVCPGCQSKIVGRLQFTGNR